MDLRVDDIHNDYLNHVLLEFILIYHFMMIFSNDEFSDECDVLSEHGENDAFNVIFC